LHDPHLYNPNKKAFRKEGQWWLARFVPSVPV